MTLSGWPAKSVRMTCRSKLYSNDSVWAAVQLILPLSMKINSRSGLCLSSATVASRWAFRLSGLFIGGPVGVGKSCPLDLAVEKLLGCSTGAFNAQKADHTPEKRCGGNGNPQQRKPMTGGKRECAAQGRLDHHPAHSAAAIDHAKACDNQGQ